MKFIVFILSFFILVVDECLTREIYNSETNKITGIRVGQFTETKDNKIQIIIETQKKLNTKIYLLQKSLEISSRLSKYHLEYKKLKYKR